MCELKCQSRRRRSRLGTMQRQSCRQGDRQRRSKQRRRQGGGRRRKPKLRSRQGGRQTSRRGENPKPRKERRTKSKANEHTWLWFGLAFFFLCGGLLVIGLAFFTINASSHSTAGGRKFGGLRRIDSDSGFGLSRSRGMRTPQSPRQRPVVPGVGALRARHPFAGLSPRSAV